MAVLRLGEVARNGMLDALRQRLDGGQIRIYTGAQPRAADADITSQTLLATLQCSSPACEHAERGAISMNEIAEEPSAPSSGTATFARVVDDAGDAVFDCDVSDP